MSDNYRPCGDDRPITRVLHRLILTIAWFADWFGGKR